MKTNLLTEQRDKAAFKLLELRQKAKAEEDKTGYKISPVGKLGQEIQETERKYEWLQQQCEITEAKEAKREGGNQ